MSVGITTTVSSSTIVEKMVDTSGRGESNNQMFMAALSQEEAQKRVDTVQKMDGAQRIQAVKREKEERERRKREQKKKDKNKGGSGSLLDIEA